MKIIKIPGITKIKVQVHDPEDEDRLLGEVMISEVTMEQIYESIDNLIEIFTTKDPLKTRIRKAAKVMLVLSSDMSEETFDKAHTSLVEAMIQAFTEANKGFLGISSRLGLTKIFRSVAEETEQAIREIINPKNQ